MFRDLYVYLPTCISLERVQHWEGGGAGVGVSWPAMGVAEGGGASQKVRSPATRQSCTTACLPGPTHLQQNKKLVKGSVSQDFLYPVFLL